MTNFSMVRVRFEAIARYPKELKVTESVNIPEGISPLVVVAINHKTITNDK